MLLQEQREEALKYFIGIEQYWKGGKLGNNKCDGLALEHTVGQSNAGTAHLTNHFLAMLLMWRKVQMGSIVVANAALSY